MEKRICSRIAALIFIIIILFAWFVDCYCMQAVPAVPRQGPMIVQTNTISIEADKYQVHIRYPYTRVKKVDAVVGRIIKDQVAKFKKDSSTPRANPDWRYTLWMDYSATSYSKDVICFKFVADEFTGGAHGTTTVITKVIDVNTGREYVLRDLFKKGPGYVRELSRLCIMLLEKKLGSKADAKMISDGAGPKAENFKSFILTPKNMIIYFQRYQVGAGYLGVQEVSIPLETLAPLLKAPFAKE